MKKQLLSILLALCMVLALLSACGEKQEPAEAPEDAAPQEQNVPETPEDAAPQEQDTPEALEEEAPPEDGIARLPEGTAPLEPYADVYLAYPDSEFFDDPFIVGKDLFDPDELYTYRYESTIIFEGSEALAAQLLEEAKDPGLGVRGLHEQGITGEGVNVAIIDQNLMLDHPEYADCVAAYYASDYNHWDETEEMGSMHAPAVLSILAGKTIGVAPGAKVYFAAAPGWEMDAAYYADCLYWIIEQNEALPEGEKIRVVSVSAAPVRWADGGGYENEDQWAEAIAAAEKAGMLVIDCRESEETSFVFSSYCADGHSDDARQYIPGYPTWGLDAASDKWGGKWAKYIFAPTSFRTTAQEYRKGNYIYTHWGEGGMSWSVPYAAGVLALGWQVNPELDAQTMRELLFASAWVNEDGCHMIDPPAFIELVKATVE